MNRLGHPLFVNKNCLSGGVFSHLHDCFTEGIPFGHMIPMLCLDKPLAGSLNADSHTRSFRPFLTHPDGTCVGQPEAPAGSLSWGGRGPRAGQPFLQVLEIQTTEDKPAKTCKNLHSLELTWKWRMAPKGRPFSTKGE